MIHFFYLMSRQGKGRLAKWYTSFPPKQKSSMKREISGLVSARSSKLCNFIEFREYKIVYKRYASLYFIAMCDMDDNELLTLEVIHLYVEILDRYFGNVCELDLIFNFQEAYFILDELLINGELQESSKKNILGVCAVQDSMEDKDHKEESIPTRLSVQKAIERNFGISVP
eukprot:65037_1